MQTDASTRKDSANTSPESLAITNSSLDIAIIGGGIAGLATALSISKRQPSTHRITIYESHPLSEVGAGIQLFSNATRILQQLGLEDAFREVVNQPNIMEIRRYEDDEVIGALPQNPQNEWEYGSPHWQVYRPDFQRLLAEACYREGPSKIRFVFNARVKSLSLETSTIHFSDDSSVSADLIIAAGGLRGKSRNAIPENRDVLAEAFPEFCFRAAIPKSSMLQHPETAELMKPGGLNMIWCGPGACVLGYPMAAGELYNVVLSVPRPPDAEAVGNWSQKGDPAEGAAILEPFCERVRRLWSLVDNCNKWQLGRLPPLPTFTSQQGNLVIIGDAAHAILPHSGQGGAMALEDAVSLSTVLASATSKKDLPAAMQIFNTLRQDRLSFIRRYAAANQQFLTMPDGPEQLKRDAMWKGMTEAWRKEFQELGEEGVRRKKQALKENVVPDSESEDLRSPETRMCVFGYDAVEEARKALAQAGV
ncbi:FAD NAD(P)-binding domain-containing [Lecanosticta acicola]|uniref:FAD NAD(P)-binding domain-containing n=1 Tax=Lecanosticta acicola TaxID=111012 RepID=A0AAI8W1D8_9PEZI|nr:FAD NAD(P)-binding domain-containing [Lecanosticta acicola]